MLGLSRQGVMNAPRFREFSDIMGMRLTGDLKLEEGSISLLSKDDRLRFIEGLARLRCVPLREQWHQHYDEDIDWHALERYSLGLTQFKEARGLLDFTDMITQCVIKELAPPPCEKERGIVNKLKLVLNVYRKDMKAWLKKELAEQTEQDLFIVNHTQHFNWKAPEFRFFYCGEGCLKKIHLKTFMRDCRTLEKGNTFLSQFIEREKKQLKDIADQTYQECMNDTTREGE